MVEIINGTLGYYNGKKVKTITQADGPQTFDEELEARLVKQGVARYVTDEPEAEQAEIKVDGKVKNAESDALPDYNTDMKLAELKEIAKAYGVDASKCTSKAEVCKLIDESLDEEGDEEDQPDLSLADPV